MSQMANDKGRFRVRLLMRPKRSPARTVIWEPFASKCRTAERRGLAAFQRPTDTERSGLSPRKWRGCDRNREATLDLIPLPVWAGSQVASEKRLQWFCR